MAVSIHGINSFLTNECVVVAVLRCRPRPSQSCELPHEIVNLVIFLAKSIVSRAQSELSGTLTRTALASTGSEVKKVSSPLS